ncbi:cyclic GMP-AMP synthase DncV-like nucleotidyltransferase [Umezawaea sp. NPDC059074]|uniref:SMODS domain-containing nucleotidyltransferase n=1 Tax=Umezawaea sp. NPDC059074 TaxID=3346716 RepID=UPI0036CFA2D6
MNIQDYFSRFVEDISLGVKQVGRIESASSTLLKFLREQYGLTVSEVFLQGSYANGTAVKPVKGGEYDVDIVCISAGEADTAEGALKDVYGKLEANGRYAGKLKLKQPCVRIEYADDEIGSFHVDVVPVRVCQSPEAPLDAPRQNQGWHPTAPNEYTAWCGQQGPRFVDLVKMIKRWRDEHQEVRSAVKSIVLQVLLASHMPAQASNDGERAFLTLESLDAELKDLTSPPIVANPVLPRENLAGRWTRESFKEFKSELASAVIIACAAIQATTLVESCERWRELFGEAFPLVEKQQGPFKVALGDASHAKSPATRGWYESLDPRYSVSIQAWEKRGKRGKASLYPDDGPLLFQGKYLRFKATPYGPTSVTVRWRVTNTGAHAREQMGLRGDFFEAKAINGKKSVDPSENHESTAYTGTHLVEVFLLVGTRVVARSAPFRVNIFSKSFYWRP